jgi:hypothetical protein
MKKSTIKRRKRVVPAYHEAPSTEGPSPQPTTSASPEPAGEGEEQAEESSDVPAAKRRRPPPSIDFTGYDAGVAPQKKDEQESASSMADYAVQAQRAAAVAEHGSSDGADGENDRGKVNRRAQLLQQAEAMRAALRAKEKEIDDLSLGEK